VSRTQTNQTPNPNQANETITKLDLPEPLKRLAESVPVIRSDVKDIAISIVLKVAEQTNTFLDVHYILNHIVAARIWQEVGVYHVALYLDNGIVIEAVVGPISSWLEVKSVSECV
jgi:hypothetical protein